MTPLLNFTKSNCRSCSCATQLLSSIGGTLHFAFCRLDRPSSQNIFCSHLKIAFCHHAPCIEKTESNSVKCKICGAVLTYVGGVNNNDAQSSQRTHVRRDFQLGHHVVFFPPSCLISVAFVFSPSNTMEKKTITAAQLKITTHMCPLRIQFAVFTDLQHAQ